MKRLILIINIAFAIFCSSTQAQMKGSGKVISREFGFKDFDKLNIENFDGQIVVEIGKSYAIKIEIDENLEPRLRVNLDAKENQLNIFLEGNNNGKLYLENTRIKIKVSMPEASVISHRGNTNIKIHGLMGRYFRLENSGNGDVTLEGSIDQLDIKKMGNGSVNAAKLLTKTAKVKSFGNGNVTVNAQISLLAHGFGNCGILQAGPGKIDTMSGVIGNGNVRKI